MQINQYTNEAFVINDEDFYDVDYWTGTTFQSRKISGATLKSILGGTASTIYNSDGTISGTRFVDLGGNILYFTDTAGTTEMNEGNLVRITANSGQRAVIELAAGNSQTRQIVFSDNTTLRWSIETDDTEIGGDVGTNLYFKAYDDSGILLSVPLKLDRQSGQMYVNNQYTLPLAAGSNGYVLTSDGIGGTSWQPVGGSLGNENLITASTQWSKTLPAPVSLLNGQTANGFTFFDNITDKLAAGTTPYYEFNIDFGITITLSGTSGTANINVNGVNYLATFVTSLFQTAVNWVAANQAALNSIGVFAFALGSGANGRIRFGSSNAALLNGITITNVTTNLSGTKANEFTGSPTAVGDHIRVPYTGEPIDGQRLLHTIRANFNISIGSVQYAELRLIRYQNDTVIGSGITIQRNPDETGQQVVIETYTNSVSDAFVTGGFYIALVNNTGTTLEFIGSSGILIQTVFQKPTLF